MSRISKRFSLFDADFAFEKERNRIGEIRYFRLNTDLNFTYELNINNNMVMSWFLDKRT